MYSFLRIIFILSFALFCSKSFAFEGHKLTVPEGAYLPGFIVNDEWQDDEAQQAEKSLTDQHSVLQERLEKLQKLKKKVRLKLVGLPSEDKLNEYTNTLFNKVLMLPHKGQILEPSLSAWQNNPYIYAPYLLGYVTNIYLQVLIYRPQQADLITDFENLIDDYNARKDLRKQLFFIDFELNEISMKSVLIQNLVLPGNKKTDHKLAEQNLQLWKNFKKEAFKYVEDQNARYCLTRVVDAIWQNTRYYLKSSEDQYLEKIAEINATFVWENKSLFEPLWSIAV